MEIRSNGHGRIIRLSEVGMGIPGQKVPVQLQVVNVPPEFLNQLAGFCNQAFVRMARIEEKLDEVLGRTPEVPQDGPPIPPDSPSVVPDD